MLSKEMVIATVVMIDVVRSCDLWNKNPDGMLHALDTLLHRIRHCARKHHGNILKTVGDAYMLEFRRPEDGLDFAIMLQTLLCSRPIEVAPGSAIRMRAGIATGPVFVRAWMIQGHKLRDLLGSTVNLAARMESKVAPVGGIAVTGWEAAALQRLGNKLGILVDIVQFGETKPRDGLHRSNRLIPLSLQSVDALNMGPIKSPVRAVRVTLSCGSTNHTHVDVSKSR